MFVFAFIDHSRIEDMDSDTTERVPEVAIFIEGQFEFPQKTKLVSAVYNISFSKSLAEPHRLELQHCVKLETQSQANCLYFVRAPSFPTILPYRFTLIEGGQFNPGSRHGVINITGESCLLAIVADQKQQTKGSDEENYTINQDTRNEGILNHLLCYNIFSSFRS